MGTTVHHCEVIELTIVPEEFASKCEAGSVKRPLFSLSVLQTSVKNVQPAIHRQVKANFGLQQATISGP